MLTMKPMAKRVGMHSVASRFVAIDTRRIRSIPSRSTSEPPPSASGVYMPASPRALVIPPPPPISAAWASRLFGSIPATLAIASAGTEARSVTTASSKPDSGSPFSRR